MFNHIANWLVAKAKKTPYFHLPGYMNRFWLVPYNHRGDAEFPNGIGPVRWWRRPFAWLLQKFDIAIRVHEILRSDAADVFHDHPWPYITVILRGGYWETKPKFESGIYAGITSEYHGPGSILFRKAQDWHHLTVAKGGVATTLFITFRYRQKWGFLTTPAHKTYYRDYLSQHPERPQ